MEIVEWNIEFKKTAFKKLKRIKDKKLSEILNDEINSLKLNPFKGIPLKGNLKQYRKLVISYKRAKDYRIIYQVIDNEIIIYIFDIGPRESIIYA